MKANHRAISGVRHDDGVSPVIAVILMVAITVVLGATVYVWVSGFSTSDRGAESAAVVAAPLDVNNNGATDWMRLTLVRGASEPYGPSTAGLTVLAHDGDALSGADFALLCDGPDAAAGAGGAGAPERVCDTANVNDFLASTTDQWSVGELLFVPCQGQGGHHVTVTLRSSTVLDERVVCDEAAPV